MESLKGVGKRRRGGKLQHLVLLVLGCILGKRLFVNLDSWISVFPSNIIVAVYNFSVDVLTLNKIASREFIKEYSASHPGSSGLKAVRISLFQLSLFVRVHVS